LPHIDQFSALLALLEVPFPASLNLLKSGDSHRNGTSLIFSSQKRPIFYLEGGSEDQLLGGTAKSRGRAIADL